MIPGVTFLTNSHGHLETHKSFFDSLLAEFPRRSVKGITNGILKAGGEIPLFVLKKKIVTHLKT